MYFYCEQQDHNIKLSAQEFSIIIGLIMAIIVTIGLNILEVNKTAELQLL